MNRKQFLIHFWYKIFRPIVYTIATILLVYFLYDAIVSGNGVDLLIVILIMALIFTVLNLISVFYMFIRNKLHLHTPQPVRNFIEKYGELLDYVFTIVLGALVYHFWITDNNYALACFFFFLIDKILDILKKRNIDLYN